MKLTKLKIVGNVLKGNENYFKYLTGEEEIASYKFN